jgi:Fic family protein
LFAATLRVSVGICVYCLETVGESCPMNSRATASETPAAFIKSALAHFWFVTIHPFEDGNGRLARAIADLMLARSEKTAQRFYSMSAQIQQERNDYYRVLEQCQKGSLNITGWIEWFLNCLRRAIAASEKMLELVLAKAAFWKQHAGQSFNDRERKVLNRLLDGFEGKLTSTKWAKLTKCSQDTALRDITDLVDRKILAKEEAGGRSTSYVLHPRSLESDERYASQLIWCFILFSSTAFSSCSP